MKKKSSPNLLFIPTFIHSIMDKILINLYLTFTSDFIFISYNHGSKEIIMRMAVIWTQRP